MAGMFYSLKETAEKLGKTEDEVKQLAEDGKLREFRDGSNLLFKIEEVNALLEENPEMDIDLGLEPEEGGASTQELLGLEPVGEEPVDESVEAEADFGLEEEPAAMDGTADLELAPEAEATSELDLSEDFTEEETTEETMEETSEEDFKIGLADEEDASAVLSSDEASEIALAPESGILDTESDITDMDTALTGQGVDVLGASDADYDVTDDSLAETVGPAGTSTEASLEEIEDDVNLDSFGSGSGLLDLSLQADDTSLGGILDEIYTAEGDEAAAPAGEGDMVEDMTAEAEHVGAEDLAAPEPMVAAPTIAPAFADVAPDAQSNMLGMLLFLPLLALLYAAVVVVAAQKGVMPSILESIQGMVWYLVGGAAVVAVLVAGASFVVGGEKKPRTTRAPKAKKGKKEKAPKEKKAKVKKEKAPKAEKAKKEKKSLFGKKKG